MKNNWIVGIVLLGLNLTSCDFLEREPLDFGNESAYFKTVDDLEMSVNSFYKLLPKMETLWGGVYATDNNSDNQMGAGTNNLLYPGDKKTPAQKDSDWKFETLRGINFFINKAEKQLAANAVSGAPEYIDHYLGEGYFFRAYDYFRLLKCYGDVPILTEMQVDDPTVLIKNTKRAPRNEVARFILKDLDRAIELMMINAPKSGHLSKDAARVMKARVALYEATWEKYHAGTCFVPGNAKWVGAASHPDFKFESGSADAEVNFFLDEAIAAADIVASSRRLNADYAKMFISEKVFENNDEVILARYYAPSIITHEASKRLNRTAAGCGYTRALVNSFLMQNGLPYYAEGSTYQGDRLPFLEMVNRDNRFASTCKGGGLLQNAEGDTLVYYVPKLTQTGNEGSPTGYEISKHASPLVAQEEVGTTATPIFRAAEAYLVYLEAYYERHHDLGGNCGTYWAALRNRAGVDPNYAKSIAATDLSKENDLATKWKGSYIDKTLYNIRRERRCEFVAEGMRLDDIKRWRALDNMVNYQVEGINLWEAMHTYFKPGDLKEGVVSQAGISTYIRPLQKSATGAAYDGYNFPKPHYLEPIPVSEFILTTDPATGKSVLYQNPGWPMESDGTANYGYDCD